MGEAKLTKTSNKCRTIALRYRFILETINSKPILQFLPHPVLKLKVDDPKPKDEVKPQPIIYEDDVDYLRSLDPKEWKSQDHYKVLGIPTLRFTATDDVIKTAYRKKVLKHHPDKRKAQGEEIKDDDDYFTCITMAYETLGNNPKRKAYDSVDPEFDNNIPTNGELKQADFYKTFTYYFDLNARWSEKRKVPKLGDCNANRSEVERFYSFWYDFKSWREYSYEDEEDKEKCQDRDERRYVDKLNKAERLRKKKEEMSRIRALVDLAYNNDPRIAKFKQEDKDRKLAAKRAKQSAAQAKKDEEERLAKEVQLAKEQAEAAERARIDAKRQEREVQKKALKKERKVLRETCKTNNYFTENSDENLAHMQSIETICETFTLIELEELNRNMRNNAKSAFSKAIKANNQRIEKERQEMFASVVNVVKKPEEKQVVVESLKLAPEWSEENVQLLVKAVNLFPAGTNQRWEVVANFLNQHGVLAKDVSFNSKIVLAKAKDMQNTDFLKSSLKDKQPYDNFKKDKKNVLNIDESGISKNLDAVSQTMTNGHSNGENAEQVVNAWTTSEQQLLEQALKTFPASTAERWDRIAECIPNRSKKDCMKRYKELVETVKAKKAAQACVTK